MLEFILGATVAFCFMRFKDGIKAKFTSLSKKIDAELKKE